jgi:hypothetical protein
MASRRSPGLPGNLNDEKLKEQSKKENQNKMYDLFHFNR